MLKFSFEFSRPHYFLTLSLIWFDENFVQCSPPPPPPPPPHTHTHAHTRTHTHTNHKHTHHTHQGHVKIKVADLEFSRNKMCNIRRAILSGDRIMVPSKQIQQLMCRIFNMPMYTIAHLEVMGARSCKYLRIHKAVLIYI